VNNMKAQELYRAIVDTFRENAPGDLQLTEAQIAAHKQHWALAKSLHDKLRDGGITTLYSDLSTKNQTRD